jgi:hypothetical protein
VNGFEMLQYTISVLSKDVSVENLGLEAGTACLTHLPRLWRIHD